MKRIFEWINQPYPYDYDINGMFKQSVGTGLFIFLFLTIFKPFEAQKYPAAFPIDLVINCGFGLITFLAGFVYDAVVPKLFPKLFFSNQVRFKHVIVYIFGLLILIGLGNAVFYQVLYPGSSWFFIILRFQLYTAAIGVFPVVFLLLLDQYWHLQRHIRNADAINRELGGVPKSDVDASFKEQPVTLTSDNQKETVSMPASRLLFIKAAGNYVEVYTNENNTIQKRLLRNTIKRVDDRLAPNPSIMRCHRAYLVNVTNIQRVTGDSQGYRVAFRDTDLQVPVSRGYLKRFKRRIDGMSSR
jgi:hypothetical protein